MVHVIVQAPDRIAAVTSHEDILCLRAEDDILERRVCLDETAMFLRFEHSERGFWRNDTEVKPGRRDVNGSFFFGALEDELRDDLLHPGCAGFAPACDDDVVWPEVEVVPAR